jgi:hypothetical protein
VAFSVHHVALRLSGLTGELLSLPSDPTELSDDCQTYGVIGDREWYRYSHSPIWWVDAEVKVLDVFPNDLYFESANGDSS